MTTFEDAKVGDRVWCILYGWSTVVAIEEDSSWPLKTNKGSYLYDGRLSINSGRTLFWDEVVITPPEKPLHKLEVDTKVLVWDTQASKVKRYFSHFNKDGDIATFSGGRTSWSTNDNSTIIWEHWELAKD